MCNGKVAGWKSGCGMIDPNVLKQWVVTRSSTQGLQRYGRERIAMVLHQIDDIRRFYSKVLSRQLLNLFHPAIGGNIAVTTTQIRRFFAKAKGTQQNCQRHCRVARY